jgi:CheY-like chemotaxis protein
MTGLDLYRRAVELRPALAGRFVLVSGDAGDAELVEFAAAQGLRVVEKPFDVNVLAALVREAATA